VIGVFETVAALTGPTVKAAMSTALRMRVNVLTHPPR
jgi:hypothetical protein